MAPSRAACRHCAKCRLCRCTVLLLMCLPTLQGKGVASRFAWLCLCAVQLTTLPLTNAGKGDGDTFVNWQGDVYLPADTVLLVMLYSMACKPSPSPVCAHCQQQFHSAAQHTNSSAGSFDPSTDPWCAARAALCGMRTLCWLQCVPQSLCVLQARGNQLEPTRVHLPQVSVRRRGRAYS
jgi:hypothetical protein